MSNGLVKHLCCSLRTGRVDQLRFDLKASRYEQVLETIAAMRSSQLCLACGYPMDNSYPHPYTSEHQRRAVAIAMLKQGWSAAECADYLLHGSETVSGGFRSEPEPPPVTIRTEPS